MPPKESLIAKAKENLSQVLSALHANPASKAHYLPLARQVVSQVDQSQIMSSPHRLIERKWFLQGLQQYATWGNTHGAYQEIAAWCETHWNGILHHDPQNAAALNGASFLVSIMVSGMHGADLPAALGSYWLYRAQPLLTRIYDAEAMVFGDVPTGSSAETLASGVRSRVMSAVTEDDTDSAIVEELRHRPDYVEARGLLSPAANFFSRAVNATPDTDPSYGHLLVEASKAYCHMGAVTTSDRALGYFLDALKLLQQAAQIPGLAIPSHLQECVVCHLPFRTVPLLEPHGADAKTDVFGSYLREYGRYL